VKLAGRAAPYNILPSAVTDGTPVQAVFVLDRLYMLVLSLIIICSSTPIKKYQFSRPFFVRSGGRPRADLLTFLLVVVSGLVVPVQSLPLHP
jgi:hypothetical protein